MDDEQAECDAAWHQQELETRRQQEDAENWQATLKADEAAYLAWLSNRELARAA